MQSKDAEQLFALANERTGAAIARPWQVDFDQPGLAALFPAAGSGCEGDFNEARPD